jgi:hypothetical protein
MTSVLKGTIVVMVAFLIWVSGLATIMDGIANLTGLNAILAGLGVTFVFLGIALGGMKEMGIDLIGKL